MILLRIISLAFLCCGIPGSSVLYARTLLFSNGQTLPGEIGAMMGGAQVAQGSGPEAMFYNPAGLIKGGGTLVSAGAEPLRYQTVKVGSESASGYQGVPVYLSMVDTVSSRGHPRFAYGFSLYWPTDHDLPTPITDRHLGTGASLPPELGSASSVDALFPEGITVTEQGEGVGRLRTVAPGVGLAVGITDWLRFGLGSRLERISLEERSQSIVVFTGDSTTGTHNTLSGYVLNNVLLQGEVDRLVHLIGLQVDPLPGLSFGVLVLLPSDTLAGKGRVRVVQSQHLSITQDGSSLSDQSAQYVIDETELPFRLETPREVHMGLAYTADWLLFAFDFIRVSGQSSYVVFPDVQSSPPFSPYRLPPIRTSARSVSRWRFGMAMASDDNTSWLFGLSTDQSSTPVDDPLFRRMDLYAASAGLYRSRGRLSGSFGLSYRYGQGKAMRFIDPGMHEDLVQSVEVSQLILHLAGSVAF